MTPSLLCQAIFSSFFKNSQYGNIMKRKIEFRGEAEFTRLLQLNFDGNSLDRFMKSFVHGAAVHEIHDKRQRNGRREYSQKENVFYKMAKRISLAFRMLDGHHPVSQQ
jgi:hypothetical protein